MKLYTLDYDCNLPVTQQVNVATNTDAKIGIKVKKDGEYINLDGSTLSVVTPELITPEPSELIGPGYKITKSPLPFPIGYSLKTYLSSVTGAKVYGGASNFSVDISQDESTWTDYDWTASMTLSYRDRDINPNILANCNVSNGETQWTWTGASPFAGQTTDTVPATEKSSIEIDFTDNDVSAAIATNPAYFRLNCIVHEPPYHATISADEELTNGYVTFPISIGDEPSLTQDTVVVDIKENPTEYETSKAIPVPAMDNSYSANILAATLSSSVGQRVYAEDIDLFYGVDAAATSGTELTGYNGDTYLVQILDSNAWPIYSCWHATSTGIDKHWWKLDSAFHPIGEPLDFVVLEAGQSIRLIVSNKANTLPAPASTEKYTHIKVVTKTEATKAQFKLNVNTFKSQQGDKEYIKELPYIPSKTVTFSGTFTDDTPFSYDLFYKD